MSKPNINDLLSINGKIAPMKIKSRKFLTQTLQKQIYQYTSCLNVFSNIGLTERIVFIRDNLNINYCKKCNKPWIEFINLNRSTFQLCKHRKHSVKHCLRSDKKNKAIQKALILLKENNILNRDMQVKFWINKALNNKQFGFKNIFSNDLETAAYILYKTKNILPIDISDIKMSERLYLIKEKLNDIPRCQNCGNKLSYSNFYVGYIHCKYCTSKLTKFWISKNKQLIDNYFSKINQFQCLNLSELTLMSKFYFKIKHNVCGKIFEKRLDSGKALNNFRLICPHCNPFQSKGQLELYEYVKSLENEVLLSYNENRGLKDSYQIDVYIPSKQFGIQYNGDFWHSLDNGTQQNYHYKKYIKAKADNIDLFQIFEHEWKAKKDIIKDLIKRKLNLINYSNFDFNISLADYDQTKEFFNLNHIQNSGQFKYSFKVFNKNKIYAIMSVNEKDNKFYIDRFCYTLNIKIDCFNKLLSYIKNTLNINKIYLKDQLTYNLYREFVNQNFKIVNELKPIVFKVSGIKSYMRYNTENIYQKYFKIENAGYILYQIKL